MMLFKSRTCSTKDIDITEKIKNELVNTFQKKGIKVSKILIDMKSDNVNVQLYVKEK